jgi:hypothetical protein
VTGENYAPDPAQWQGLRRWVLLATVAFFAGDALFGHSRTPWEKLIKGLLTSAVLIGELIELVRRRTGG